MSPGCPGCNTGTPAYRALRVGSIEYVGLWHDNAARTFPRMPKPLPGCKAEEGGKFYWSKDVAASVHQLAERIVSEGQTVGYMGLQYPYSRGVAVFESVGPTEHYKRLGAGGWRGKATRVQVAGFDGVIVEQGGGWTNAVYKITVNQSQPICQPTYQQSPQVQARVEAEERARREAEERMRREAEEEQEARREAEERKSRAK